MLQYEIVGDTLPTVVINLNAGQSIYTQRGAMTWMTDGIVMTTNMRGGLNKAISRAFIGESMFIATYTAHGDRETIALSSTFPGHILDLDVKKGCSIIAQKQAFLCAEDTVELSSYIVPGFERGLFGGEGFILQRLHGEGVAFLEVDGNLMDMTLGAGEKLKVSTGHVAAFDDTVGYQIERVGGLKNTLFGGEGFFHTTLIGPGRVWLQTITLANFSQKLLPYLPINNKG